MLLATKQFNPDKVVLVSRKFRGDEVAIGRSKRSLSPREVAKVMSLSSFNPQFFPNTHFHNLGAAGLLRSGFCHAFFQ